MQQENLLLGLLRAGASKDACLSRLEGKTELDIYYKVRQEYKRRIYSRRKRPMAVTISAGGSQSGFNITDQSAIHNTTTTVTLTLNQEEAAQVAPIKAAVEAQQPTDIMTALQDLAVQNVPLFMKIAGMIAKAI